MRNQYEACLVNHLCLPSNTKSELRKCSDVEKISFPVSDCAALNVGRSNHLELGKLERYPLFLKGEPMQKTQYFNPLGSR